MARHIALLAGEGRLVDNVRDAATRQGHRVSLFYLTPFASKRQPDLQTENPGLFLDRLVTKLGESAATHLLAVGGVRLSAKERREVGNWLKGATDGELSDDKAPQILEVLAGRAGMTILGADEILPEAVATPGAMAGRFVPSQMNQFRAALEAARALGNLDFGQGVVFSGGRPVAAEGVEGTDGLIARAGEYVAAGQAGGEGSLLVLAKALRPGQPRYFDMPAVGPDTVRACKRAKIDVIALEAGGCLMADRKEMLVLAERLGVGVVGITLDD
jgi:UDP-2,3-diacylglucosamine hydrolase